MRKSHHLLLLTAPNAAVSIKSLGTAAKLLDGSIGAIALLGSNEKLTWSQTAEALTIEAPCNVPSDIAVVFKITPRS